MSLEGKMNVAIKAAMLAKDAVRLRGLRAIKAAIQVAKTEKGAPDVISEDREIQILTKLVKQRKESIEIFEAQNRVDLAITEKEEVAVIEEFLPAKMSESEVITVIQQIIASTGASSGKDMGKVIGAANKELAGKADGRFIADMVKGLLNS
jgi:uncharacterized protein YqeY